MSSEEIDKRLREVSQLYQLGVMLKSAKKVGKVKDIQAQNQQEASSVTSTPSLE